MKKSSGTHGGKRSNAGRKKLPKGFRKVTVSVFPTENDVKKVGGLKVAKALAYRAIVTV